MGGWSVHHGQQTSSQIYLTKKFKEVSIFNFENVSPNGEGESVKLYDNQSTRCLGRRCLRLCLPIHLAVKTPGSRNQTSVLRSRVRTLYDVRCWHVIRWSKTKTTSKTPKNTETSSGQSLSQTVKKVKVHTLDIAPLRIESPMQKRSGMARVLKGFHSFTCTPTRSSAIGMSHTCLCLPSYNWYSFTDPGGMEGWVDLGAK